MIKIIACLTQNGVIGKNNDLVVKYKKDLMWFKQQTLNYDIIMGRKTFESLKQPLPNRNNIVISKTLNNSNVEVIDNLESAVIKYPDAWIIGGSQIYEQALNFAEELWITIAPDIVTGDNLVYFPFISPAKFAIENCIELDKSNNLKIYYYKRI